MNRQEQRALRAIERNLAVEDPRLAELLRTYGKSRWNRVAHYAGWIAVPFTLLGFVLGDGLLLLTAALLVTGAVLGWSLRPDQGPGSGGSTRRNR
ncbi:DUF3040 domain-containing protein [Pseudonocardia cypriaca]|uniref:DUF3040 family protein n=1 Tax=Pseudonocardia cypriaca TaxID=882449 RepID=A0A543FT02_9PSEU|nr:DUF3040 domain-containing protein [Pseudonocardia cypriaca]TQM36941.1 DUF3040 family protein [Pseudonocardia cypriaca]